MIEERIVTCADAADYLESILESKRIEDLRDMRSINERRALEMAVGALRAGSGAQKIIDKQVEELRNNSVMISVLKDERDELTAKNEALLERTLWQRIVNKKPWEK